MVLADQLSEGGRSSRCRHPSCLCRPSACHLKIQSLSLYTMLRGVLGPHGACSAWRPSSYHRSNHKSSDSAESGSRRTVSRVLYSAYSFARRVATREDGLWKL